MSYNSNSGGSDYALNVYGSGDNQVAAQNQGNLIQMNNPVGGLMKGGELNQGPIKGGRRRKGSRRRGGTGLGTMLVPAGLVLASNYANRRFKGKNGDNRSRRGRGFKPFMSYGGAGMPNMIGGSGSPMPPVVGGAGMGDMLKMGGSGVEMPKMGGSAGGSTLVDIAVPAGLVYMNDRYYNRKNRNTNRRRRTGRRTRGGRRRKH